ALGADPPRLHSRECSALGLSFFRGQLRYEEAGGKGNAKRCQRFVMQIAVVLITEFGGLALALTQLRLGILFPVQPRRPGRSEEMLLGFHALAIGSRH